MLVTCDRCETEFNTQRDHPAGRHASTTRCPSCGRDHDVEERPTAATDQSAIAADGGVDLVEQLVDANEGQDIHIHLHQH